MEALHRVFGSRLEKIPIVANKSQTGHTLGAAGVLECIVATEGMEKGIILPTLNYIRDPEFGSPLISDEVMEVGHGVTLLNSIGFGGVNSCIVVARVK